MERRVVNPWTWEDPFGFVQVLSSCRADSVRRPGKPAMRTKLCLVRRLLCSQLQAAYLAPDLESARTFPPVLLRS